MVTSQTKKRLKMDYILVPDGYNGDFVLCEKTPIAEDATCYKLRVAEVGKEYMIKWIGKQEYNKIVK